MDRPDATAGGTLPGETAGAPRPSSPRLRTMAKILKAGETVFAKRGFDGATTAEIACEAGVAKATLHYYFQTKEDLYKSVLDRILDIWAKAMDDIDIDEEPADALRRYIARKVRYSCELPDLTRLWAIEVLSGAPHIQSFLSERVCAVVDAKGDVIRAWVAAGKMDPVEPTHLFFMIWSITQTYAECAAQIRIVLRKDTLDDEVFKTACETVTRVILKGLGLSG